MKAIAIIAAGLGLATVALPTAASAQAGWQSINQRQQNLDRRIDQGVRNSALNRNEAQRLRGEFRALNQLENRYRRSNGLSQFERRDLEARFNALSARIRIQRNDRQGRRY
jgi:Ni/Co efflux regulator RcnB